MKVIWNILRILTFVYLQIFKLVESAHVDDANNEMTGNPVCSQNVDDSNDKDNIEYIKNITFDIEHGDKKYNMLKDQGKIDTIIELLYRVDNLKSYIFGLNSDKYIIKKLKEIFIKKSEIKHYITNGDDYLSMLDCYTTRDERSIDMSMLSDAINTLKTVDGFENILDYEIKTSHHTYCKECEQEVFIDSDSSDEIPDISDYGSITNALDKFIEDECYDHFCPICIKETELRYSIKICELQDNLLIEFGNEYNYDIHSPYLLKKYIDLTKYIKNNNEIYKYVLSGVLVETYTLEDFSVKDYDVCFISNINGDYYKIENGIYKEKIDEIDLFEKKFGYNKSTNKSKVARMHYYTRIHE